MKRIFITLVAAWACVFNVNAQLVVDSLGRVGIDAADTLRSKFTIGKGGSSDVTFTLDSKKETGMYIHNYSSQSMTTGLTVRLDHWKTGNAIWARTIDYGSYASSAIVGQTGGSQKTAGVHGGITNLSCISGSGIYGTTGGGNYPYFDYPGIYAGYFRGDMLTTGKIMGTLYTSATGASGQQAQVASATAAVGNKNLLSRKKGEAESVLSKLTEVPTLEFMETVLEDPFISAKSAKINEEMEDGDRFQATMEIEESPASLKEVLRHGVDAEKLSEVYPELVAQDSKGNYLVNYVEMVPLLLQSIRELSARVEELEGEKSSLAKKAKATSIESESESTDIVRMSQNKPNPFSESSVITLSIPEGTKSAAIYIYDLSGKQVKNIPVDKRGKTDITVYASDLPEGMFVYSLVTDGTVAATRRMMVVKN